MDDAGYARSRPVNPLRSVFTRARRYINATRRAHRVLRPSAEERRYLTATYDHRVPLPEGAKDVLVPENPRLRELCERYSKLEVPATRHVHWSRYATDLIRENLQYFRGDSPYIYHYREAQRVTWLKYFIFFKHIQDRDPHGLLDILEEDGAFGCWHFTYPDCPIVSRDMLDSVNEIYFLDRHLGLFSRSDLRVLDIGAGYGRLAHRMLVALPQLSDYCCVDAIPESTFLCEYYLAYRGLHSRGRSVPLDEIDEDLKPGEFDLAVNIHSFSECTLEAVAWWVEQLTRLKVPQLLVVPNDPAVLRTKEQGGKSYEFQPVLESAGYRLTVCEPVFADLAVQDVLGFRDRFYLFELRA